MTDQDITDIVPSLRFWGELLQKQKSVVLSLRITEAADEIERLRAEHDALRAERDEVRQSYCSLMEAYRGGDGSVTANKLGWGYLFPRRPKKEHGK